MSNPGAEKRRKERSRQEKQRAKEEKRKLRRDEKPATADAADGGDPALAGIVPGPQPQQAEEAP
ncbi:MAG: hypothetical protein HY908_36565 [Myxococcales bacterium]|nr:hypothetical protein [Myxococcales bacterium]